MIHPAAVISARARKVTSAPGSAGEAQRTAPQCAAPMRRAYAPRLCAAWCIKNMIYIYIYIYIYIIIKNMIKNDFKKNKKSQSPYLDVIYLWHRL